MKLLLDQNLSRRLLQPLESLFPGSSQVALLGMAEADDATIWSFALREDFAIVTKDAEFVEMAVVRGFPPKVLRINLGNVTNDRILVRMLSEAEAIGDFLANTTEGVFEIE